MNKWRDQVFPIGSTFDIIDYIEGKKSEFNDKLIMISKDHGKVEMLTRDLALLIDTSKRGGQTTLADNVESNGGHVPHSFTIIEHIRSAEEEEGGRTVRVQAYKVRPMYLKVT